LERGGFQTFVFGGEWEDLEHHVMAGRPLIVGFQSSGKHISLRGGRRNQ